MSKFSNKRRLAKIEPATRIEIEIDVKIIEFHSRKLIECDEFKNEFYFVFNDGFLDARDWLKSSSSEKEIKKFLKGALKRSARSRGAR
jgi:hypothetical protein